MFPTGTFDLPAEKALWFLLLLVWTLVWKGMAMWKAARKGSKPWFIAFLVVNTLGILEILYIYVFSERGSKKNSSAVAASH